MKPGYELPPSRSGGPVKHILVVFGGVEGIEAAIDDEISQVQVSPTELFDAYLNTCEKQTSRTIRTEEALTITLAVLRPYVLG